MQGREEGKVPGRGRRQRCQAGGRKGRTREEAGWEFARQGRGARKGVGGGESQ